MVFSARSVVELVGSGKSFMNAAIDAGCGKADQLGSGPAWNYGARWLSSVQHVTRVDLMAALRYE
jgi:hypothetical protein